jgi:predicted component of type VI protein secretion system
VSRRHAEIRNADGLLLLIDSSSQGTAVNGTRAAPAVEIVLLAGDEINLAGEVTLIVR